MSFHFLCSIFGKYPPFLCKSNKNSITVLGKLKKARPGKFPGRAVVFLIYFFKILRRKVEGIWNHLE